MDVPSLEYRGRIQTGVYIWKLLECKCFESQESKHDHQRVSVDGEERTKDSALESSSSEPQREKQESRRKIRRGI